PRHHSQRSEQDSSLKRSPNNSLAIAVTPQNHSTDTIRMDILIPRGNRIRITCPYAEGATFTLEVTPPDGPALQIRVRVVEQFRMSSVMKPLKSMTIALLISLAGLGTSNRSPGSIELNIWLMLIHHMPLELWPSCSSVEMGMDPNTLTPDDDNYLLREHYVALSVASFFTSECNAYERLPGFQGDIFPIFYGTTRFLDGEAAPNLDLTKLGIPLQYIEGTVLDFVGREQVNIDLLARKCLDIIELYSQLGVLHFDVGIESFIVKPDGSGVVMIDFADSELRKEGMSEHEWRKKKWAHDEEGEFGDCAASKWGWNFQHSYRWRVDD
ncbi:unnamed protein product, partial [Rhizoctonia solani]